MFVLIFLIQFWAFAVIFIVIIAFPLMGSELVKLNKLPLIITHPEARYDRAFKVRDYLQTLATNWNYGKVIILYSSDIRDIYLDVPEAIHIHSSSGELRAVFETDSIVILGGYLGYSDERGCMNSTIADAIMFHQLSRPGKVPKIHIIAKGVYHYLDSERVMLSKLKILLFDFHDAHWGSGTTIGSGILPQVSGYDETFWPPLEIPRTMPVVNSKYIIRHPRRNIRGHLNTVTTFEYNFRFFWDGIRKTRLDIGIGSKQVNLMFWSSEQRLLDMIYNGDTASICSDLFAK